MLAAYIPDQRITTLLDNVIDSFSMSDGKGLPLGNLTSQLFVNVHMNAFDQFIKCQLRVQWYIRYADDFILILNSREWLVNLIPQIQEFLTKKLRLTLHPRKVSIKTLGAGVDFLGWVHFPTHRVLRTTTKRGMIRKVRDHATSETLQSYLGLLKHGNTHKTQETLLNQYWISRATS